MVVKPPTSDTTSRYVPRQALGTAACFGPVQFETLASEPGQDPQKIAKLVEKQIRKLLPKSVDCKFEVLSTGKPWFASFEAPIFKIAQGALEKGFGRRAVFIREGGSIPFVTQMHDTFKVPCVLIGFGLPDENAHAPDEHIALENYFGGIKSIAHFYADLATL